MTQWNVRRGPPLDEGKRLTNVLSPPPWPERINAGEWYGLVWSGSCDQARLGAQRIEHDALGVPQPRTLFLDRKYLPLLDLCHLGGDDVFISERLARALSDLGVSGFGVQVVPHASPFQVTGYRWFRLKVEGWLGRVVDTMLVGPPGQESPSSDPVRRPNKVPVHPLCLDSAEWSGHSLCWSPWFGRNRSDWRYLLLPGHLLGAAAERLPDLSLGAFPVRIKGAQPSSAPPQREVVIDLGPLPQPVSLGMTVEAIEARRSRHALAAGASSTTIGRLQREAAFPLPEAYLQLLRRWNGVQLYLTSWNPDYGALNVWPVERRAEHAAKLLKYGNAGEMEIGNQVRSGAWFPFGEDVQGNVMWCVDAAGLVRGLGKEGIVYGPDAPFEVWLGDMVRDMDWACDHPEAPGAGEFLALGGRM